MKKNFKKSDFKMSPEELEVWFHFRKAHSRIENKKGKGSYNRQNFKKGK